MACLALPFIHIQYYIFTNEIEEEEKNEQRICYRFDPFASLCCWLMLPISFDLFFPLSDIFLFSVAFSEWHFKRRHFHFKKLDCMYAAAHHLTRVAFSRWFMWIVENKPNSWNSSTNTTQFWYRQKAPQDIVNCFFLLNKHTLKQQTLRFVSQCSSS